MRPNAWCPLRPDDHCTLCVPGATGPENCPAVYQVMNDPELRERLREVRREAQLRRRQRVADLQPATA